MSTAKTNERLKKAATRKHAAPKKAAAKKAPSKPRTVITGKEPEINIVPEAVNQRSYTPEEVAQECINNLDDSLQSIEEKIKAFAIIAREMTGRTNQASRAASEQASRMMDAKYAVINILESNLKFNDSETKSASCSNAVR